MKVLRLKHGEDNMKIAVLFEDSIKSPISRLLKRSINSDDIFFSEGCGRLCKTAEKIYKTGEYGKIIMFVDISPDNSATVDLYERTIDSYKEIVEEKGLLLDIIPIFCIEYYVLSYIREQGVGGIKTRKIIDNKFYWEEIIKLMDKSFERRSKRLLDRLGNCFSNKNPDVTKNVKEKQAWFYFKDCVCSDEGCIKKLCVEDKANLLYSSLPLFVVNNDNYVEILHNIGVEWEICKPKDIICIQQGLYNDLCDFLKVDRLNFENCASSLEN